MVRGLDVFRRHFEAYTDRFVLIGGSACEIVLDQAGLPFRATRDLDMVLCAETLDIAFTKAFWAFVRAGQYKNRCKSSGRRILYRFSDPEDKTYPDMLELFSRTPDALTLSDDSHLTPIPVAEEVSSLSAILMDDAYYAFVHAGKMQIDGLPVARPECLIPLKARAWMELSARKAAGERVDEKDIRKHKNDVFRLYQVIAPDAEILMPDTVRADMIRFVSMMEAAPSVDLQNLGLRGTTLAAVLSELRTLYGLHG